MQLVHKHDPVGVDVVIEQLQRELFIDLTNTFGWRQYYSYPRAYRNEKNGDKLPEIYTTNGNYKEVLFDNTKTVTSFFLTDEERTYDDKKFIFEQGVSIIFQANLKKLFPNVEHRADEELINTIWKAIANTGWENKFLKVITGVEKVYDSLKLTYDKKYFDDMSYYNVARFYFKVKYTNTRCGVQPLK